MKNVIYLPTVKQNPLNLYTLDVLTPVIGFKFGSLALHFAGYAKIQDIANASSEKILQVPHIGRRKLMLIKEFLSTYGVKGEIHKNHHADPRQMGLWIE